MSEITARIQAYRDGKITFDELVTWLRKTRFPKPIRMQKPKDPFLAEQWIDYHPGFEEGTWDEVTQAAARGILTQEEHYAILRSLRAGGGVGEPLLELARPWWALAIVALTSASSAFIFISLALFYLPFVLPIHPIFTIGGGTIFMVIASIRLWRGQMTRFLVIGFWLGYAFIVGLAMSWFTA